MRLLDRYIARHVVASTLLTLAVLVALLTFITFVEDLDSVGKGDYTLLRAIEYMALTTPHRAFALFPMAALIGSLMGLGALAGNLELAVIRASGVSVLRIAGAVLKGGAVLMVIAVIVGEVLAPWSERIGEERRSVAMTQQITLKTAYGFWVRDGLSFINIRTVLPGNLMADVYIYEFDAEHRLRVATFAKRARHADGEWQLEDVVQSEVDETGVTRRALERATWSATFEPDLVDVVAVRPESLSAYGLYRYIAYLEDNGLSTARYELALWNKFMYPIATGVMIFLAIPLVLGRLRSVGIGQRVLVGTLAGIGFHISHQSAMHVGVVYDVSPAVSTVTPTALFLGFALWLMRRVR